ncbi:MAG: hypothetical protein NDI77_12795 [Geobacteraceae bacterium]|nr:hypothetical protein [Geobacteraceae bacterium]
MNKRILIALVALSLSVLAETSFAAAITSTTSIGGLGFTPSNRVNVRVRSAAGDPTATPPTQGEYAAGAYHDQGSRTFATNSDASIIYWKDTTDSAVPAATDSVFTGTGWTSM